MTRIAIDPVTRIEGHLRIEVEVQDGEVRDAWSSGTMFRGIEMILRERDPREAWVFAQRACGVCTTVHALASVRAVEDALGITIPPNARLARNIIAASQFIHDHVVHFYHLHALDWVDVLSALDADPDGAARLQTSLSAWRNSSPAHFASVQQRLRTFVGSGQLGPFANGYWGHPAYRLSPEANLLLVAHYLEALDWQRNVVRIHAILGGKNPHPQTYLVGGMALRMAPDAPTGLNTATAHQIGQLAGEAREFIDQVLVPDVFYLADIYRDWADIGRGPGNFLSYGDFAESDAGAPSFYFPSGRVLGMDLRTVHPIDQTQIAEAVAHSWYRYDGAGARRHPWAGETTPSYTGPPLPYDSLASSDTYSWLKAPTYAGERMEVGPLARLLVAYAADQREIRGAIDSALRQVALPISGLNSTLGRILARALETQLLAAKLPAWVEELTRHLETGDLKIADLAHWDPQTWPATARGVGLEEAPRGALGHWIVIQDKKIANYQMVVPSTWNGSPRDEQGRRGAWEEALVGTPVHDPARPLEVLRTVHSFDPCMACAVHVFTPGGSSIQVQVM